MQKKASQLVKNLENVPEEMLHEIFLREAIEYSSGVLTGVQRYLNASITLNQEIKSALWREGSSSLLACGGMSSESGYTVLFVPSLINRSYIFDLRENQSFLGFMRDKNVAAVLLDWGDPGGDEVGFQVEDYVTRLNRAVGFLVKATGNPVVLAGYCMGGMISLAASQLSPKHIAGLALFATPWDFHAEDATRFNLTNHYVQQLEKKILSQPILPKSWMQLVFYLLYASHIHKKYQTLAKIDLASEEAQELLAIEHWANDGIELISGVAKNCLIDWGYHNTPMKGGWHVQGKPVIPESVQCPTLVVIAKHDRIAPYHAALPLSQKISGSELLIAETGHVGMITGRYAKKALWQPFAQWLSRL